MSPGQSSPYRAMQRLSPGRARDHPVMEKFLINLSLSLSLSLLLRRLGWISQRASLLAGTQTGTRGVELGLVLLGANDPAPPQLLTSAWEEEAPSPSVPQKEHLESSL